MVQNCCFTFTANKPIYKISHAACNKLSLTWVGEMSLKWLVAGTVDRWHGAPADDGTISLQLHGNMATYWLILESQSLRHGMTLPYVIIKLHVYF